MSAAVVQPQQPQRSSRPRPRARGPRQHSNMGRSMADRGEGLHDEAAGSATTSGPTSASNALSTGNGPSRGVPREGGQRNQRDRPQAGPQNSRQRPPRRVPNAMAPAAANTSSPNHAPARPTTTQGGPTAGRTFGGHLTSVTSGARPPCPTASSNLQADAPEFVPSASTAARHPAPVRPGSGTTRRNHAHHQGRPRRSSRSSAPDVITRIHEDIQNNVYECAVCTNDIGPNTRIWSCRTCWTVFHLTCVKKWSKNDESAQSAQQSTANDASGARTWRCPGCNLPRDMLPSSYFCWCGKETDPRPLPGLPPHSCGQTCGKPRTNPKACPHPCELACHAGPCPPCGHMGPTELCFCGKQSSTKRCIDTDYEKGWSCGEVCGDLMPCAEHQCEKPCHEGLCGQCEAIVDARCYCGKVEKPLHCHERGEKQTSQMLVLTDGTSTSESWTGSFNCHQPCGRFYDCGKHQCQQECHAQSAEPGHCPLSTDVVWRCPCGKTPLAEVTDCPRQSCEDVIPNCTKQCLKRLACGHECRQLCHAGECPPCAQKISVFCRCGRTESKSACHQGTLEAPQCRRLCKATLNCGRHECGERCCPGERQALERQASKRKQRPLEAASQRPLEDTIEPEHVCTRDCGRKLKCGNHTCHELCHKGPCGSCREAIFDDVACHCGRTVLQPPLPCGTQPPVCQYNCSRPKSCGHPQVAHNCHGDNEECPKCPFLTEILCMCGNKMVKNQQCWRTDVSCGEVCGKLLRCGSHRCRKTCHRAAECEDASKVCQQVCGKLRKACGHACEEPCHAPYACPEDRPCQHKILVTCACQHLKKEVRCGASKHGPGHLREKLVCDDECVRLERNRKLALALNIDPDTHKDDHVPYSKTTLDHYASNPKWAQTQERAFRAFAVDETRRQLRFKPMQAHLRAFLHALAEDFGFDSESLDPEPHRHVVVFKTPRFVMAPMKTLAQCAEIRPSARTIAATAPSTDAYSGRKTLHGGSSSSSAFVEPANALLLLRPRFALTAEELHRHLDAALVSAHKPVTGLSIEFLPSKEVVVRLKPTGASVAATELEVESLLRSSIYAAVNKAVVAHSLAAGVVCCRVDASLNVLWRDTDAAGSSNNNNNNHSGNGNSSSSSSSSKHHGWNTVAAKAGSAPRTVLAPARSEVGEKSVFTVLGSRARREAASQHQQQKQQRRADSDIVEDWEQAEEEEEKRESVV